MREVIETKQPINNSQQIYLVLSEHLFRPVFAAEEA